MAASLHIAIDVAWAAWAGSKRNDAVDRRASRIDLAVRLGELSEQVAAAQSASPASRLKDTGSADRLVRNAEPLASRLVACVPAAAAIGSRPSVHPPGHQPRDKRLKRMFDRLVSLGVERALPAAILVC